MNEINPSQPKHQKPKITTEVPGPRSRELRAREEKFLAPGSQRFSTLAGFVVESGRGSAITDVDGNTYLDLIGGIGVNGLGHSHPKVVAAIRSQVEEISVGSFTSRARVELLEKLGSHAPAPLVDQVQLYSGGSEAVESALRLAKSFTGKYEFVSFSGGFHGKTLGSLALMGSDYKHGNGPYAPGNHIAAYADCFRCPLKLRQPSCGLACVEVTRAQLKANTSGKIAAFIVEPMQGTAGNVIPPKDFLPALQSVAKDHGALFIADEMITGFGRTGTYWGTEHSGISPDIVTIGKQFGGGTPVSGLIARRDIVQAKPWSNPSGSSSSYGGNPLVSAAASAALSAIDDEKLVQNSRDVGAYFLKKLEPMVDRYPFVGEVRGSGLFLAIEFVRDKSTREPLPKHVTQSIFMACVKRGLLTMAYDSRFRIQPSMTIDTETVDEALAILTEVLDELKKTEQWTRT